MRRIKSPLYLLPGIAGLFFVRLLLEMWAVLTHTAVSLPILIIVIMIVLGGVIQFSRSRLDDFFDSNRNLFIPLVFLLAYIFYPQLSLRFGIFNLVFVLLIQVVLLWEKRDVGKRPFFNQPIPVATGSTLIFAGIYLLTLAPDVLPADNGEFQWVATEAGVLHPPGFPFYTMVANLFTQILPFLSPAVALSVFALVTSSLTLFVVYLTVAEEGNRMWWAITAVIALGTATTFWAQATIANIRSLTGLFAAIPLYLLLKLRHANRAQFDRWLLTAVFFTSLGVAHHPSLGFFAIIFVIYVLWLDRSLLFSLKRLSLLALAIVPGLLTYIYLPLRAQSGAPGSRESLATWSGFLNHALARGFSGDFFFFIEPNVLLERFRVMGNVLAFQWGPILLAGFLLGAIGLLWHDRKSAFLLIGSFLLHTFITATYRAPQTVEYMLPAYVSLVLILGLGTPFVLENISRLPIKNFVLSGLLLAGVVQGANKWSSFQYLQTVTDTRDTVVELLELAEPNSIILADWHWFTPLRYVQDVDGIRQDVEVRFVSPDGLSYGETWANRISAELENGRSVIATHFDPDAYRGLPVAQPVGEAFKYSNDPLLELPETAQPVDVRLGDINLLGVDVGVETAVIGNAFPITVAWESTQKDMPQNLFIHLVGFDGLLYGQDDRTVIPAEQGLTQTRFWLTLRPGSQPGDYAIFIGSGSQRENVGNVQAIAQPFAPVTQNRIFAPVVEDTWALVGYDWDQTLPNRTRLYLHWQTEAGYFSTIIDDGATASYQLPQLIGSWGRLMDNWSAPAPQEITHYVPLGQTMVWMGGGTLPVERPLSPNETFIARLKFASGQPILRDTAVSVRLIGFEDDQFQWAWWDLEDSIPAMGAIPTLKWIAGSQVTAPHFVTTSDSAVSGQTIGLTLRAYDAFTNQPLPILDERITSEFQWIPMSQAIVE